MLPRFLENIFASIMNVSILYQVGMGKKRNTYKDCGEKNLRKEIISMN